MNRSIISIAHMSAVTVSTFVFAVVLSLPVAVQAADIFGGGGWSGGSFEDPWVSDPWSGGISGGGWSGGSFDDEWIGGSNDPWSGGSFDDEWIGGSNDPWSGGSFDDEWIGGSNDPWSGGSWDDEYTYAGSTNEPYEYAGSTGEPYTYAGSTYGNDEYCQYYNDCYSSSPSYQSATIGSGYSSYSPVSWGSTQVARAVSYPSYSTGYSYAASKPVVVGGGTSVHYVTQPAQTKVVYVPKTETKYVEVAKPVVVYRDTPSYHYDTPAAPTCTITATKTSAQTYTLTWYSYGSATSAAITNLGTVNLSGSRSISPHTAMTYVMTVYGKGGSNTCETTVQGGTPNVMVTLSQVPYTGLDLGPMGMAVYFTVLAGSAIAVAYMLFFWRGGIFNRYALAGAARDEDATIVNEYTLPGYGNTHNTIVENGKSGVTHDSMTMVASDGRSQPRIVITRG